MWHRRMATLALSAALSFGLGAGLSAQTQDKTKYNTLPASVGYLSAVQLVEVRDGAGQVLIHGTFVTDKNTTNETEREAELKSPTGQRSKGDAEIDIVRKDGVVTAELEVEVERLPAMTSVTLFIDGQTVTSFLTDRNGKAELKLTRKSAN